MIIDYENKKSKGISTIHKDKKELSNTDMRFICKLT